MSVKHQTQQRSSRAGYTDHYWKRRDIATALIKQGHTPIVYSTILGDVARELRLATIPVIDNLNDMTVVPDIIHGQHHMETMTALLLSGRSRRSALSQLVSGMRCR